MSAPFFLSEAGFAGLMGFIGIVYCLKRDLGDLGDLQDSKRRGCNPRQRRGGCFPLTAYNEMMYNTREFKTAHGFFPMK